MCRQGLEPRTRGLRASGAEVGELLVSRVRDAMLGLAPAPARVSAAAVRAGLDGALADFRDSRYARLSVTLPRLISADREISASFAMQASPPILRMLSDTFAQRSMNVLLEQ